MLIMVMDKRKILNKIKPKLILFINLSLLKQLQGNFSENIGLTWYEVVTLWFIKKVVMNH